MRRNNSSTSRFRFLWYLLLILLFYPFIIQLAYALLNFWGTYVLLLLASSFAVFRLRRLRSRPSLPPGPAEREPFEPFAESDGPWERRP